MSDKALAEMLNVSEKTISRSLKALEDKGLIKRNTKNIKNGKERHITINIEKIEECLAKDKMTVDSATTDKMSLAQRTNCPLPNGQNDLIKDNILKDNILKDNFCISLANANEIDLPNGKSPKSKEEFVF